MIRKRIINIVKCLLVLLFFMGSFIRCASIMTPTGGPKDTIPPVVVGISPENYSTIFSDKSIYIEFNEYVKLENQQKEFYVSPMMSKKPQLAIRGRGVVVTMRDDSLRANTTYALNFGSTIVDNNEGNPLHSFRYVFSTGESIDSMIMSGYTVDASTADSVSKSFIFFYPVDSLEMGEGYDSTLLKRQPVAIGRAENNGIFITQNLKPIDYKIYAFEDSNTNQTYEAGVDKVATIEGLYNPANMPDFRLWYDSTRNYVVADPQLYMRMFMDIPFKRQILQDSKRPIRHKVQLSFGAPNPEIISIEFDSIASSDFILEPTTIGRDTFNLWFNLPPEQIPDSIRGTITYLKHDSVRVLSQVSEDLRLNWRFVETREQKQAREDLDKERERAQKRGEQWVEPKVVNPFKVSFSPNGEVNPERGLTLNFDYPLLEFDYSAVELVSKEVKEGDTIRVAEPITITRDSVDLRRYHISSTWDKVDREYTLTLPEGAIVDIARQSNDSISNNFKVLNSEKHAVVVVNLSGRESLEANNYILELLDGSGKLIESKMSHGSDEVIFNYVKAGDISLRITMDSNYNLMWDTGNLVEMRQPERVELYSSDGESKFTTKENWEMELDVDLSKLFAPITMESVVKMLEEQEIQRLESIEKTRQARQAEQGQKKSGSSSGFGMGGVTSGLSGL